jgi:hypothetical protein
MSTADCFGFLRNLRKLNGGWGFIITSPTILTVCVIGVFVFGGGLSASRVGLGLGVDSFDVVIVILPVSFLELPFLHIRDYSFLKTFPSPP